MAIAELLAHYAMPVYGPAQESVAGVSHAVDHGDRVNIAQLGVEFAVLSIPGHTRGHIAFYGHNWLFCGDTLFSGGCGRLFEGTAAQMHDSLQRLAALPDNTQVYCGHEYTLSNLVFAQQVEPDNSAITRHMSEVQALRAQERPSLPSSIGLEKQINPFLRANQPAVQQAASRFSGTQLDSEVKVFAAIRRWKDGFRG